jgi:hypothetical protein
MLDFSGRNTFISVILSFFLFFMPFVTSYAAAGCCSHHGGVTGCDQSSNHQSCKDGTVSPTCMCNGSKAAMKKTHKNSAKTTTNNTTADTAAATTTSTTAASTTTAAPKNATTTKGCCSKHGGVAKCDKATGYQICKDGTHSTTCKC